jgi:hypothetical protein
MGFAPFESVITIQPAIASPLRSKAILFSGIVLALTVMLSSCNHVVLDERFYNERLDGWTVIDDPQTVEGPSLWRVEKDGWLHQRSNIWGKRGDFLGRWYGTYLVTGDTRWKDYLLAFKARAEDNDGFGAVFRFKDPSHFYRLLLIEDGMNGGPLTRLDKRDGADFRELWSARKGYQVGTEMRFLIEADGDNISVSVNGERLCDVKDSSYPDGKTGLFCFAQAGQAFDDVKVVLK